MKFALITILLSLVLAGCGQKGSLYLPPEANSAETETQTDSQ